MILWVLCPPVKDSLIFWLWSTGQLAGRRWLRWLPSQQNPVSKSFSLPGLVVQCSSHLHLWQGSSVNLLRLDQSLLFSRDHCLDHDCFSSSKQRHHRVVSLFPQVSSTFMLSWFRLVSPPAPGSLGFEDDSQGWYWPLYLQGCLWISSHCSWRVPQEPGVASVVFSKQDWEHCCWVRHFTASTCPSLSTSLASTCSAEFVFVRKDASVPSLAPLYRGPYLVLEQRDKFFRLQLGSRMDVVSLDQLKPGFSKDPISVALPPVCGQPALRPALWAPDPPKKSVWFQLPPPVPVWRNPRQMVCYRRLCSAVSLLLLLEGLLWPTDVFPSVP